MSVLEMSVLERYPYYEGVHIRKVSNIREMSALERCPYWGDVSIREMSILERCLH